MKDLIPHNAVYRLSLYHRCLEDLRDLNGGTISSEKLAQIAGVKPTQLRKDLAYCGSVGTRGRGYDIEILRKCLAETLGTSRLQPVVLVGAGNLGSALLHHQEGFAREGFEITAAFDLKNTADSKMIRVPILPIADLGDFITSRSIKMAILCVPGAVAQDVCNTLVLAGIQAILNFAPVILQTPPRIAVNNVNLAIELEHLSYFIQ